MDDSRTPVDADRDTAPALANPAFPMQYSLLKQSPCGLINLRVHISDEPGAGPLFSADGWDVIRAGPLAICLKLEA